MLGLSTLVAAYLLLLLKTLLQHGMFVLVLPVRLTLIGSTCVTRVLDKCDMFGPSSITARGLSKHNGVSRYLRSVTWVRCVMCAVDLWVVRVLHGKPALTL